jgi:hypothetical protein
LHGGIAGRSPRPRAADADHGHAKETHMTRRAAPDVDEINRARELLACSPLMLSEIEEAIIEVIEEAAWAEDPRAETIENDVLSKVTRAQKLFEKARQAGDWRIQQAERAVTLRASGLDGALEIAEALSKEETERTGSLRIKSPFFDEAEEEIAEAERRFLALFGDAE